MATGPRSPDTPIYRPIGDTNIPLRRENQEQTTRRGFLKFVGTALGGAAISGLLYKAFQGSKPHDEHSTLPASSPREAAPHFENDAQRNAYELLSDPATPKLRFEVRNDPDVQMGGGLHERKSPFFPTGDEISNAYADMLKPGDTIEDAVYWPGDTQGEPPISSTGRRPQEGWIAYKRKDGTIAFSNASYLNDITKPKP